MKVQIPDQLKADVPPTNWGKMLAATPVVMAVVATLLAGLASSEMTRAQYDRALAAQQQSKAGDQWSFFQAKRLRGAFQRNSLDLLQSIVELHPLDAAALKDAAEQLPAQPEQSEAAKVRTEMLAALDSPAGQQALAFLQRGEVPPAGAAAALDPNVKAALGRGREPDAGARACTAPGPGERQNPGRCAPRRPGPGPGLRYGHQASQQLD